MKCKISVALKNSVVSYFCLVLLRDMNYMKVSMNEQQFIQTED